MISLFSSTQAFLCRRKKGGEGGIPTIPAEQLFIIIRALSYRRNGIARRRRRPASPLQINSRSIKGDFFALCYDGEKSFISPLLLFLFPFGETAFAVGVKADRERQKNKRFSGAAAEVAAPPLSIKCRKKDARAHTLFSKKKGGGVKL